MNATLDGAIPTPAAAAASRSRGRLAFMAYAALALTAIGLLNFGIVMTSELADRSHVPVAKAFVWEMTGAWAFLVFVPALAAFIARFPLARGLVVRRLPLHLAVLVCFSVMHTLTMWGSRTVVYRVAGWGSYDYGDMRYRFPMEGLKQVFGYAVLVLTLTLIATARRERERQVTAARLEQQLSEARLAALKMQLNPHFLFNTLNMISSHIHDDPDVADAMLSHLADFLRMTLHDAEAQEVPLARELEFLDAYLAIMKARFEDRLAVAIDVRPEIRATLVPHLVLQPLVENAVTHSMSDHSEQGRIEVAAARHGERLVVTITDNGPGPQPRGDGPRRGVGLANTAERLRHLYGGDHRLELAAGPAGGTRVVLEVPYREASAPGGSPS